MIDDRGDDLDTSRGLAVALLVGAIACGMLATASAAWSWGVGAILGAL